METWSTPGFSPILTPTRLRIDGGYQKWYDLMREKESERKRD